MLTLAFVVAIALAFDFTNGFHDTANAMASSIATRAIPPRVAVLSGRRLNVARRVPLARGRDDDRQGRRRPGRITLNIVFAGLIGAITWNLITWYLGLPSSRSHALSAAWSARRWRRGHARHSSGAGIVQKVLIPRVLAPFLAGTVAIALGTYLAYR